MKRLPRRLIFTRNIVLLLAVFFLLHPGTSIATSPQDVKLDYDAATETLSVTITHPSSFPSFHYIKYVEINNGSGAIRNTYDSQPDQDTFTYTYKVSAAPGAMIEVTATCSLYGYKTVYLTLGKK
ncbi:MAG TPA: hypothetical protein VLZ07_09225 [Syntrophales bacterium]|nr:hypothetical protein [Syntrophales bacterium]